MSESEYVPGGCLLLARKLFDPDSWLWNNTTPTQFSVLLWLLFRARWQEEPSTFPVGRQMVTIQRGQLFTSHAKIAEATRTTVKRVRRAVELGQKTGYLRVGLRAGLGMTITICNYNRYQDLANYSRADVGHSDGQTEGRLRADLGQRKKKENQEKQENKTLLPTPKRRGPLKDPTGRTWPDYFDIFWQRWPHKVGKPEARDFWINGKIRGKPFQPKDPKAWKRKTEMILTVVQDCEQNGWADNLERARNGDRTALRYIGYPKKFLKRESFDEGDVMERIQ